MMETRSFPIGVFDRFLVLTFIMKVQASAVYTNRFVISTSFGDEPAVA